MKLTLTDLEPRWIHKDEVFAFRCPHCRKVWLTCKRVKMSQKEQHEMLDRVFGEDESHNVVGCKPAFAWEFSSLDFSTMTVKPSLDSSPAGHWHGFITEGRIE